MRSPVHGHAKHARPGLLELDIAKLWESAPQAFPMGAQKPLSPSIA
jgi:hypothetical protein